MPKQPDSEVCLILRQTLYMYGTLKIVQMPAFEEVSLKYNPSVWEDEEEWMMDPMACEYRIQRPIETPKTLLLILK